MKIGRNKPCPCGSGKKFKHCCLRLERGLGQGSGSGVGIRRAITRASQWEADIVPIPAAFEDDPTARPAAVLLVADGFVVHSEILSRPSPEPQEMAAELARQLARAVETTQAVPRSLVVRYPDVAAHLRPLVREAGWKMKIVEGAMPELDNAARSLREQVSGSRGSRVFASSAQTWASWGLGPQACEKLFAGAAAYHRAAPWRQLRNTSFLDFTGPSGDLWTLGVLGHGGEQFGISLYGEPSDPIGVARGAPPEALTGPVLSLLLDSGAEIPREMRKEVASAGWEVAAPDAYPYLLTINTPAGGLTRRAEADLLAALHSVLAFLKAHGEEIEGSEKRLDFRDPMTGSRICYWPGERRWNPFMEVGRLRPGGVQGHGADLDATFDPAELVAALDLEALEGDPSEIPWPDLEALERFERSLTEEGLGRQTVGRHLANAEAFIGFLNVVQGARLTSMHEADLRLFLFEWSPLKSEVGRATALAAPTSLKRFLRFLATADGIWLPTATDVLADKELYEDRLLSCPEGAWWDQSVGLWRSSSTQDLYARRMLPDRELESCGEWGAMMGPVEARLLSILRRRWLGWRDQLLESGMQASEEFDAKLSERQRKWETTPRQDLDGNTPAGAIAAEREQAVAQGALQGEPRSPLRYDKQKES